MKTLKKVKILGIGAVCALTMVGTAFAGSVWTPAQAPGWKPPSRSHPAVNQLGYTGFGYHEGYMPDPDSDGDGVPDSRDRCPGTPKGVKVDYHGCPMDSDGDGVWDSYDKCPGTPKGVTVYSNGCPIDSDGDGVADYMDKCPGTPKGLTVDAMGCPLDSDADGVYDHKDKCPGTPKGAPVDDRGCWVLEGVHFSTGKWDIRPESARVLEQTALILKDNPDVNVEVQGHTDNVGNADFNEKLSDKRATAVMEYLVNLGIDANRLSATGYGMRRPAATNDTAYGRSRNRRVEINPSRM
ncbi:MAG: OmpA family protein [Magnetococcales bacterium]|nr:OmpA family protein [Magnetococcales bacterium]